ncbi:hypothetical protein GGI12_006413 [Dipsacomyces acuminosporus]|nr:hypothetical protein GGI12_006413 [Dipsacomyces acuminosporus]
MRTFAALLVAASATLAQEVGVTGGPNVASGTNGISAPNVNSGWEADSSAFVGGSSAAPAGVLNNVAGSTFTSVNSNSAVKNNIINNPSQTHVKGNDGWTANGDANNLGPVQNLFGSVGALPLAGAIPFFKRGGDVVFANNHHQNNLAHAGFVPSPAFVQPAFVHPWASALPFGGVQQNAAVVGGIVKRGGDVVFANNHEQVNAATGFFPAPGFAPFAPFAPFAYQLPVAPYAVPAAIPAPVSPYTPAAPVTPVAPVAPVVPVAPVSNASSQKATVIQNQV